MGAGGVYITGLRETTRALEKAGVDVEDLKDVMGRVATVAADTMTPLVPRRSGLLAASVRPNRAKAKAVVTLGRARVPYARPIAYGWPARRIRPGRFVERTDAVMEKKTPELLEQGWADIAQRNGLT